MLESNSGLSLLSCTTRRYRTKRACAGGVAEQSAHATAVQDNSSNLTTEVRWHSHCRSHRQFGWHRHFGWHRRHWRYW